MIKFACFSPHPPILLPSVGSKEDRLKLKKTLAALDYLRKEFKRAKPDAIIISSPHPDWGIKVPLHFLISNITLQQTQGDAEQSRSIKNQKSKIQFKIQNYQNPDNIKIEPSDYPTVYPILTTLDSPWQHYEWGKKFHKLKIENLKLKIAIIASGDMSHCLKADGPYGFNPDGPKYDKSLIEYLNKKDIKNFLKLDNYFPEAAECGLRSFSFLLGILTAAAIDWQPEILSYEGPFGVGYLVANFKL